MELNSVIRRNIETLRQKRAEDERLASGKDRLARRISRIAGSIGFVIFHGLVVVTWIVVNAGLVPLASPFDPTFVILATTASVEALFLSTFILISQNRAAEIADRRVDPEAAGSYVFRALLVPGLTLLWPLVLARWMGIAGEPAAGQPEKNEQRHLTAWTCLAVLVPAILIAAAIERRVNLPSPASQQISATQVRP